jgi:hypothetical protein
MAERKKPLSEGSLSLASEKGSSASPPPDHDGQVLQAVTLLVEKVDGLMERVSAVEAKTPRTIVGGGPDKRAAQVVSQTLEREASSAINDGNRSGTASLRETRQASTSSGHPIPSAILNQFPRRFASLQQVKINPESWREGLYQTAEIFRQNLDGSTRKDIELVKDEEGNPKPKLWSDVLGELGIEGYGVVRDLAYMERDGSYKYTVDVPGLTGQNGDGFAEEELLPA